MKLLSIPNFSQLEKTHGSLIGVIYAILDHFVFVISNFIIQKAGKRLNTFQILSGVGIFLLIFNFTMAKSKQIPICNTDRKITKMLFIRAAVGPLGAVLGFMGFTMIPVSECTAIQMTSPAFTAILATIFFREKYDMMLFLNTILCFAGVIFISKPAFLFGTGEINIEFPYRSLGIVITLMGAFVGSFVQIAVKQLGSMVSPFVNTLHFAIFLGPFMAVAQMVVGMSEVYLSDVIAVAAIGICHCVGHVLMNKSFALGSASTISLMMYSQVFLAYIIDVVFMGTTLDFYSVIGSISIFFCVFITLFRLRMQNKKAADMEIITEK